jgi:hypothetical protein
MLLDLLTCLRKKSFVVKRLACDKYCTMPLCAHTFTYTALFSLLFKSIALSLAIPAKSKLTFQAAGGIFKSFKKN